MASKTAADPTGQRDNRRKAAKALVSRLRLARNALLADLNVLQPTKAKVSTVTNAENLTVYAYDMTSDDLQNIRINIQSHLDNMLVTAAATMPPDWWYKQRIELPFRQGTLDELLGINRLLESISLGSDLVTAPAIDSTSVLLSPKYLDSVRKAEIRNYGLIKTLSQDAAADAYRVIEQGIQAGQSRDTIMTAIRDRFSVAESNAERIAATEVNRGYNDARLEAVTRARDSEGVDIGVLHISSLIPTTRASHAARHGNAYTPEQQTAWWNEGVNRINCLCTTRTVIFEKGKVKESELQKSVKDMRPKNAAA